MNGRTTRIAAIGHQAAGPNLIVERALNSQCGVSKAGLPTDSVRARYDNGLQTHQVVTFKSAMQMRPESALRCEIPIREGL